MKLIRFTLTYGLLGFVVLFVINGAAFSLSTEDKRQLDLKSFEVVWKTIRDKHFDPKLGGLDWKKIYKEFRLKAEKAKDRTETRALLNKMLGRLKQTHFGVIPGELYDELKSGKGNRKGAPGFQVRVIDGKALVVGTNQNRPAHRLGVRNGWEIVSVGKDKIQPVLVRISKAYEKSPLLKLKSARSVLKRMLGKRGEKRTVEFIDQDGKKVSLTIPLVEPPGKAYRFGNMPLTYVDFDSKTLTRNIAYFRLSAFLDPPRVMPAFEKHVLGNLKAKGFILDLRGNPGGLGLMAVGFGNWFNKDPKKKLGTMISRQGSLHFVLNRRPKTYDGPLAILVDGLTASTSEILAGGLQDLGRARVFGTPTAAAALPSVFEKLPNGDGFQYAIANYISVGGKPLEALGVRPDVEVRLTREALLKGADPVLDAAVEWIQSQRNKNGNRNSE